MYSLWKKVISITLIMGFIGGNIRTQGESFEQDRRGSIENISRESSQNSVLETDYLLASQICPKCGAVNSDDAGFCQQCGAQLNPVEPAAKDAKVIYCPRCGAANDPNAKFCTKCGAPLKEAELYKEKTKAETEYYKGATVAQKFAIAAAVISIILSLVLVGMAGS